MSPSAMAIPARSPGERYAAGVAKGDWQDDSAQRAVLPALDRVWRAAVEAGAPSLWQRLRGRKRVPSKGLYLWGRVGRGKTFLTELLGASLAGRGVRRVHFHRFMQEVHAGLRRFDGERDPLERVAADVAARSSVLILDEFHVGDIGDAMILGNLLRALFSRGLVLVTTSNAAPSDLYRDGLQRERFLPAIALLEAHCDVVELVSPHDWRLRVLKQAPVWIVPAGAEAERRLLAMFQRIARGEGATDAAIELNGRSIPVRREADGVIWFDFASLCEGPRAVADYIEIARAFHTVLLSNVPQFTPLTEDAARRFIELVDELYDRGVKLAASAPVPIVDLYDGVRLRAEFARTESRLIEMQSETYLARPHRP